MEPISLNDLSADIFRRTRLPRRRLEVTPRIDTALIYALKNGGIGGKKFNRLARNGILGRKKSDCFDHRMEEKRNSYFRFDLLFMHRQPCRCSLGELPGKGGPNLLGNN